MSFSDVVLCEKPNHWGTTYSNAIELPHTGNQPYRYEFEFQCRSSIFTRVPNKGTVVCEERDTGVVWLEDGTQQEAEEPPLCSPNVYIGKYALCLLPQLSEELVGGRAVSIEACARTKPYQL